MYPETEAGKWIELSFILLFTPVKKTQICDALADLSPVSCINDLTRGKQFFF